MQRIQNKVAWGLVGALSLLVVASLAGVVQGGPLDPTAPPGPTMKTLDEVEPRTPISSLPLTISTSGSYYLTGDLTCTACSGGAHGIVILADDVTLDLNGFALSGVVGSGGGVLVLGPFENIAIYNGTARDWGGDGIDVNASHGNLRDLRAFNNGGDGIDAGDSTLINCVANLNGGHGITGHFSYVVRNCVATGNGFHGFQMNTGSELTDCTARGNGLHGIVAHGKVLIRDCNSSDNFGDGIRLFNVGNTVIGCVASGNADGVAVVNGSTGNRIEGCVLTFNSSDGISVAGSDNYFLNNVMDSNVGIGIHVTAVSAGGNRIEGNNVTDNGLGIGVASAGNIVDANNVTGNTTGGIEVTVAGNGVTRNAAGGNVPDYSIVAGNTVGPLLPCFTGTITSDNPWANFDC